VRVAFEAPITPTLSFRPKVRRICKAPKGDAAHAPITPTLSFRPKSWCICKAPKEPQQMHQDAAEKRSSAQPNLARLETPYVQRLCGCTIADLPQMASFAEPLRRPRTHHRDVLLHELDFSAPWSSALRASTTPVEMTRWVFRAAAPHSHSALTLSAQAARPHTVGASRPPSHSALTLKAQAALYQTISACFSVTLRNRNKGNLVSLRLEKTATSNEKYARVLEGFVRLNHSVIA
jgi:hypothetical protein